MNLDNRLVLGGLIAAALASSGCTGAGPDEVCKHAEELATKAGSSVDAKQCAFVWEMRYETLSVFEYKEKADCAMEASSLDALNGC